MLWTRPADELPLLTGLVAGRMAAGDGERPAGVIAGRAASRLWGFDDERGVVRPQLVLPRAVRRAQPPGVRYQWDRLAADEVTVRAGLPVTSVARTLVDLAADTPYAQMLALTDAALRTRLIGRTRLDEVAASVPLRARRALLDGDGRAESPFESRARAEVLLAGLPAPVLQYVVRDRDGRFLARVDLAWPERRLAVEADGAEVHAGPAALRRDLRRQNALVVAGWIVLRFTWADLGGIAAVAAAELAAGRARPA